MIKIIFGVLLGSLLLFGGYFFGANQTKTASNNTTPTPETKKSQTPIVTTAPSIVPKIVPITEDTISYGNYNNNIVLKYRDKVYAYDEKSYTGIAEVTKADYSSVQWYGLLNAPSSVKEYLKENNGGYDEILSLKLLPDRSSFAFVMRWGKSNPDVENVWDLPLYYYDGEEQKLNLLLDNVWPGGDQGQGVPIIKSSDESGNFLQVSMHSCWNCGGHQPVTALIKIDNKQIKTIGKTSYFSWKENGNYEYKEYNVIPCDPPLEGPVECSEKPENLPLLTGSL